MLRAFIRSEGSLKGIDMLADRNLPDEASWVDLYQPTREEEVLVETALGIEVPTHEEMQEIEVSSRLYQDAGALYMTATILAHTGTQHPESQAVTFILADSRLVTLRYTEPRPFDTFAAYVERQPELCATGEIALIGLLDAIIDRTADILERVSAEIDTLSREIFERVPAKQASGNGFEKMLSRIGQNQYLTAKARESLVSLSRLLSFLKLPEEAVNRQELQSHIKTLRQDILSLSDQTSFVFSNINFLLDTVLGMINIEQNSIIKIFSVAAVVFLPPTLVASIYGMNFDLMPELRWELGYPLAILLMVASAVLPYLYFKRRGWL